MVSSFKFHIVYLRALVRPDGILEDIKYLFLIIKMFVMGAKARAEKLDFVVTTTTGQFILGLKPKGFLSRTSKILYLIPSKSLKPSRTPPTIYNTSYTPVSDLWEYK